ncbi:MAG: outer membrane beta-barrel domain-containing protein [Deltaproteobacteria bacterium]|nr:outer membrane beta-barrel domain-containing protein [Deltaproteobacteria bacterium]
MKARRILKHTWQRTWQRTLLLGAWLCVIGLDVPIAFAAGDTRSDDEGGKDTDAAITDADACIDENVKADLFAKRKRRDVRDRLFQQTNRHEMTLQGGYYASDMFDGTYVMGAAYAYHMTEDFAVEASAALTRISSSGGPELERAFTLLGTNDRRSWLFDADLVWDPAHGKLRLGGSIQHFDLYLAAGAGVVDSVLSSGIAGNAAIGLKFFLGRAMSIRIDFRNHVYRQQLLARKEWVNDVTAMIGIGVFLPVSE